MIHIFLVFLILIGLLLILWGSVSLGRRFGLAQLKKNKLEVVSVAEGAVFGLLGLMIAFTFSGAYDRYENRKIHLLEEANTFETAYAMIDLLQPQYQTPLRNMVRQYLDLHLASYNHIPYLSLVKADLDKAQVLQHQIWKMVVTASKEDPHQSLIQLVVPAINQMFDAFHTGIDISRLHPPPIVFLLLVGLAALGGFLIGYNTAETKTQHPVHVLCYVLLTAFIIYLIMNLEFPRVGFIRMNSFDQMLVDVRKDMT